MGDEVIEWCETQLELTRTRKNPRLLAELDSGWVVFGETQFLPGYCLLLSRIPAGALTELPLVKQAHFLADLALVGQAVHDVCQQVDEQFLRINYEVLGNHWNYLHGHVYARYSWEPAAQRFGSVHGYGPERHEDRYRLGDQHQSLAQLLRVALAGHISGVSASAITR